MKISKILMFIHPTSYLCVLSMEHKVVSHLQKEFISLCVNTGL